MRMIDKIYDSINEIRENQRDIVSIQRGQLDLTHELNKDQLELTKETSHIYFGLMKDLSNLIAPPKGTREEDTGRDAL